MDNKVLESNGGNKPSEFVEYQKGPNMVGNQPSCANCERLEDKLYHESRRADEVAYLKDGEIKALQAKLDKACAALEFYRGDDDDDTSWMEPDQYVPYWTLWHDGSCVNGQEAKEALAEIRKKDE